MSLAGEPVTVPISCIACVWWNTGLALGEEYSVLHCLSVASTSTQSCLYMGPVWRGSSVHYLNIVTVLQPQQTGYVLGEELEESVVKLAKPHHQQEKRPVLCVLLMVSYAVWKLLSLNRSYWFIFYFFCLGDLIKESIAIIYIVELFYLCSILGVLW